MKKSLQPSYFSREIVAMGKLDRITIDPAKMSGVPCVRGLRIPVATITAMIADGMSVDEILEAYPDLKEEDVWQAVTYAVESRLSEDSGMGPGGFETQA